jgi:anti-sigma-K factor RskA
MNDDCKLFEPELESFADGTLNEDDAARVTAHLEECPKCLAEVRALRAIADTLTSLPFHPCPDRVTEAVWEATIKKRVPEGARERKWDWSLVFGWRGAVAGMAAASIALLLFLNPFGDQNGTMPGYYDSHELAGAGDLAKWSLLYVAQTIRESEREIVHDVVVEGLPRKIRDTVNNEIHVLKGEKS